MNDEHDDLTGIFENIEPSDFIESTDAPKEPAYVSGANQFDKWVESNLATTRIAYKASSGNVNPIALLAKGDEHWSITPNDDETLGEYVERVRQRAKEVGATWLYVTRKTLVGSYTAHEDDDIPDTTDPAALQDAIEKGLVGEGVFYYAECLLGGYRRSRHGLMKAAGEELGDAVDGSSEHQTVGLFQNMLG